MTVVEYIQNNPEFKHGEIVVLFTPDEEVGNGTKFVDMSKINADFGYTLDDIPFKNVYFHGMLRDEHGAKFSKSSGNGIDPIEVCDKYGTDALRFCLITGNTPGNDSRFYTETWIRNWLPGDTHRSIVRSDTKGEGASPAAKRAVAEERTKHGSSLGLL